MSKYFLLVIFMLFLNGFIAYFEPPSTSMERRAKFINEFVKIQTNTNKLLIYFCRNAKFNVRFAKIISKKFHSHQYLNNSATLKNFMHSRRLVIILDQQCYNVTQLLTTGFDNDLFGESNYWLIFSSYNQSLSNKLYLPVNSNVFAVNETSDGFHIASVFKYCLNDVMLTTNYIGQWTERKGFSNFQKLILPKNRLNLMRRPMRVSYFYTNIESLNHTTDFRQVEKDNLLKLNYVILSALADFLNATYVVTYTPTVGLNLNPSTQLYEDNSMMGNVQRGKADIMGITGWIGQKRLRFFKFFGPTTPDTIRMMFRAPPISRLENIYLMPFDCLSWYCIAVIFLIGFVVLFIIMIHEKYFARLRKCSSLVDIIMTFISALLQKSWDLNFNLVSGRLSLAVIYLTFLVIFNAYSASIIVFLQGTSESIKNFNDLYHSEFEFGVHDVDYNRFYILAPNEKIDETLRQKIFKEKISKHGYNKFFLTLEKGIEKMHQELYAFQCQVSSAYYLINKLFTQAEKCSVRSIPAIYRVEKNVYLGTQKNSSFFNHYEIGIRKIFESGLQNRACKRLFTMKLPCEGNISYFSGIGIVETRFIFAVFISGMLLSLLILLLERTVTKFRNSITYFQLLRKYNFLHPYTE